MNSTAPPGRGASPLAYMDTRTFWQGAREGRLLLQFCKRTGRFQFYPRPTSVFSGQRDLEWRPASGRATLAAWSLDRLSALTPDGTPRVQALVDLEEDVRLLTWLIVKHPAGLFPGQALVLHWVAAADGLQWPAFTPVQPSGV